MHVHGGAGHDVMEGSDESLAAIERLMVRHGVTTVTSAQIPPARGRSAFISKVRFSAMPGAGFTQRSTCNRFRAKLSTKCGMQRQVAFGCSLLHPS
jgi:hypothetical protein